MTILLAAAAPAGLASAAERGTVGQGFLISGPGGVDDEDRPAVACNTEQGEYLVVWRDLRNFAINGADIYGRRVSAAGKRLGPDFRISDGVGRNAEDSPSVAYDPDTDEYLVVWSDSRNTVFQRGADIFGRRVSAAGAPQDQDFLISGPNALRHDRDPAVAYSPDSGEYLVVWTDSRDFEQRNTDIYGRRVSGAGQAFGPDFRISGPGAKGAESSADLAYSQKAGEYLVVWGDGRNGAAWIFGRRVKLDGSRPEAEFRVSGGTAVAAFPAVAYHPQLVQYLVAWQDERNAATGKDIYAVRLSSEGERIGVDRRITDGSTYEGVPKIVFSSNSSRYLLVWVDEKEATGGVNVVGQALSGRGAFVGAAFLINGRTTLSALTTPDTACDPISGRCLVVWPDGRAYAERHLDIYGRFAVA